MLTLGIDDAGRGPLIGPMVVAGALWTDEIERKLSKEGIKDSKMVAHPERVRLASLIKGKAVGYKVLKIMPYEIDASDNLNTLEAERMAEVVNSLNVGKLKEETIRVVVDCPSTNISSWQEKFESFIKYRENLKVICEHKADANHLSAGAASILAKVQREEDVAAIKNEFGEIGSGYPSDPTTKEFLAKHGKELKDSGIFRKSWSTWRKMFPGSEQGQRSLGDF